MKGAIGPTAIKEAHERFKAHKALASGTGANVKPAASFASQGDTVLLSDGAKRR